MSPTVAEQLSIPEITEKQALRFRTLCERVNKKDISANKSYEYARADGGEGDEGFKGTFKDWVALATTNGWIQQPQQPVPTPEVKPEPEKRSVVIPVVFGVIAAVVIFVLIKSAMNKEKNAKT